MSEKTISCFYLAIFLCGMVQAQLQVSAYNNGNGSNGTGHNLLQFIQTHLVGAGITVSNATYVGANRQIGNFNSTNTLLYTQQGVDKGIILTTGLATNAIGPNTEAWVAGIDAYIGNTQTDSDLADIAGSSIKDKCIIEFDFVPVGSTIEFNYIFGSDEYPEFVNQYNDAFGFFLSGPGITGPFSNNAINLALVPNTSDPVTINTINGTTNSSYYVYNGDPGNGTTVNPYKSNNQYIQL